MAVADLFVTKSGTVSVCEAIFMNLPILIDARGTTLPWEKFNHTLIQEQGFGEIIYTNYQITQKINMLLKNPTTLDKFRTNLTHFKKTEFNKHIKILVHYMISRKFVQRILKLRYNFLKKRNNPAGPNYVTYTSSQRDTLFQTELLSFYQKEGRSFLWRNTQNPYHILVSEIMLQQTQADRVVPKYELFLLNFPTLQSLADAPLREVLTLWQGLGYNRRAMGLHKAAQIVAYEYQGMVPDCQEKLMQLPSIGPYTAGAVCAFAFNQPTVFIETNIRSVFIHFFFQGLTKIPDRGYNASH